MSISINLAKAAGLLVKYSAPIVSYEALKLNGYSYLLMGSNESTYALNGKPFFEIIIILSNN